MQHQTRDLAAEYQSNLAIIAAKKAAASKVRSRERQRWAQVMARCYKPTHPAYKNYGGRGIRVYPAWHDFDQFFADVGACPGPGLSLDRKDNDGDYEPGNIQWATAREQATNTRRRAAPKVSLVKIGNKWRALVRVSASHSFTNKSDAAAWGDDLLARLLREVG
jgi:hypothetical protein